MRRYGDGTVQRGKFRWQSQGRVDGEDVLVDQSVGTCYCDGDEAGIKTVQ